MANVMQQRGQALEEERQTLFEKLLSSESAEKQKPESLLWNSVQLTGPVLGKLPRNCTTRCRKYAVIPSSATNPITGNGPTRARPSIMSRWPTCGKHTRTELRKVLNPIEVEEFVLRYSHNAHQLRGRNCVGSIRRLRSFAKYFAPPIRSITRCKLEFGRELKP